MLLTLGLLNGTTSFAQPEKIMDRALAEFEKGDYANAIEYLKQALIESPDNAEIYYYLGYFLHYLCYDSMPLTGYGMEKSDEVLQYLQKAVELDPQNGNAYYFIGAEYGVRAREAMRDGNPEAAARQFQEGARAGGYPPWLIEYGRNTLRSCEQDAILFVHGDADTNPIQCLQWAEKYRTDVTVIPMALLEEPWFVALLKNGLDCCLPAVPISWSERQIYSMHPYKWKTNTIRIPISDSIRVKNNIEQDVVEWELKPNLGRGEQMEYISAGRGALADIIVTNKWQRPVYFSIGCPQNMWEGLGSYMQTCGLTKCLLPYQPDSDIDIAKTKDLLLDKDNFKSLPTLRETDMPRVSRILQNYRALFFALAYHYAQQGENETAKTIFMTMKSYIPEEILPMTEHFKNIYKGFESMFE
jgi:tetratricopeptide (TPR) repeat protein